MFGLLRSTLAGLRGVNEMCADSWQAQYFASLDAQISRQAQHFVDLEVPMSWQAQCFMDLGMWILQQSSRDALQMCSYL